MGRRGYPLEFRRKVLDLVNAGGRVPSSGVTAVRGSRDRPLGGRGL
jgi:hypothetical protein